MRPFFKKGLTILPAVLLLLLSGCFFRGVDELYSIPEAPPEYYNLQVKIGQIQETGGECIAPLTGEKIQSVQLQDLDGDGVKEAIVFVRKNGEEKPLQIYIFRQMEDDYCEVARIEGSGSAINSVQYENLDDNPNLEVIVSWQMGDRLHSLAAYSVDLAQNQTVELMRSDYAEFRACDLDRDGRKELLLFQLDSDRGGRADFYNYRDGALGLESSAPMSLGVSEIVEVKLGKLRDGIPAVFVASNIPGETSDNGRITDIYAWYDTALHNITLHKETGTSNETIRFYTIVGATDINGDGITELPQPVYVKEYRSASTAANFWILHWRQFDVHGNASQVFSTYYNNRDGWYLILPTAWENQITMRRDDKTGGGERGVVLSYWAGDDAVPPVDFLTIYTLSGSNRAKLAAQPGRFPLLPEGDPDADIIYAAEFLKSEWDCGLDEDSLRALFQLIQINWSSGF